MTDKPDDEPFEEAARKMMTRSLHTLTEMLLSANMAKGDPVTCAVYKTALLRAAIVISRQHDVTEEEFMRNARATWHATKLVREEGDPTP